VEYEGGLEGEVCMYRRINNALVARIVVDVDCDAAEGRDFGGEFVEAGVVLSGWSRFSYRAH
jgi:hypothetical protein